MDTIDYRQLCLELFGTDDVAELRDIAKTVRLKNSRNAGRKRKFTEVDVREMQRLQAGGKSINEIAQMYGTSRQMVGKYLNEQPTDGCTLRMTYMYRQHPCTLIDVDFLRQKIYIQNRTDDLLHRAFGVNEQPTWQDFELFLQERCFPPTRGMLKDELARFSLDSYDPLQIVERTHGKTAEDNMWLKFQYYEGAGYEKS